MRSRNATPVSGHLGRRSSVGRPQNIRTTRERNFFGQKSEVEYAAGQTSVYFGLRPAAKNRTSSCLRGYRSHARFACCCCCERSGRWILPGRQTEYGSMHAATTTSESDQEISLLRVVRMFCGLPRRPCPKGAENRCGVPGPQWAQTIAKHRRARCSKAESLPHNVGDSCANWRRCLTGWAQWVDGEKS